MHQKFMAQALALAEGGRFTSMPNPRVGCVLVKDGEVVGSGWHRASGDPHAEIEALRSAGAAARGAVAYVNLEPCNHHGRTAPCCEALIEAGVRGVVAALEDPNPQVSGGGFKHLREAGVDVVKDVMCEQARALNAGFISRMRRARPHVVSKLAMSLDGRVAMASGESRWITGPEARRRVQALRAGACAVLTGVGTAIADDPSLTVRREELSEEDRERYQGRQPLRVVVEGRRRLPAEARLLAAAGEVVRAAPEQSDGALALPADGGGVDLAALLKWLAAERLCNEVLVEAGPALNGALLRAGLIDEMHFHIAPKLLGSEAKPALELELAHLADAVGLRVVEWGRLGEDLFAIARPADADV